MELLNLNKMKTACVTKTKSKKLTKADKSPSGKVGGISKAPKTAIPKAKMGGTTKKYMTGGPTGDDMGTMKSGSKTPKDPKTYDKSSGKGMTATNPIKKLGGMMRKGGTKKSC